MVVKLNVVAKNGFLRIQKQGLSVSSRFNKRRKETGITLFFDKMKRQTTLCGNKK